MTITQQQRQDLTLAVVAGEHQIDADCIRLHRDPTKEGSALSQLVDRVVAVIEQSTAQPQAVVPAPPQEFESAQGRALASAWGEGWAQCRDAEFIGEDAQDEAFNQSVTLAQCLHADQTRFQGGLSNDQLRRAWSAKLPNVIPTDEQLTAFALGIEAAAQPSAQAERAPVVQAGEYPPLPEWAKRDDLGGLVPSEIRAALRAYVDADRASSGATPAAQPTTLQAHTRAVGEWLSELYAVMVDPCAEGQTTPQAMCEAIMAAALQARELAAVTPADVRMLTRDELNDVALSEQVGWGPGEYVEAIQRKFCEVNKLRIPADGVIGSAA